MSGFKEKTWKKWKESKTTSPAVTVTRKNSIDSITSQRSSSLIRSKKRHETRNAADNILAAENRGIIVPRTPVDDGRNNRAITDYKDHRDAEQKNDFKNKSTSPFNTLAPKNPFYRENVVIVQYGELKENDAHSPLDTQESNELWGELPSTEVAESSRPTRKKGPKGGSKHPTKAKKSHHKPKAPPASPTTERTPPPPPPPAQAPPKTALGPSASHGPVPHSGQSHHPRTLPSSEPTDGICEVPECPARIPKQKERLCMAPECPVTLKKAVVKEAKKAMKRSSGKKRKNPLTILGAALMSTFAGHDSSCKLTKEEKRALKRMKQAEEDDDDNYNTTVKAKKSRGVQCKAPILQKSERAHRGPEKTDKSTVCEIPECPIATQKIKVKEFMDKGQMCDIPGRSVKEPPPRKEKKVEPPKGCPSKPCTLKTKDEEFLRQLDPGIFEKLPRLKMTCDQAFAEENEGQTRPHHTSPAMKNEDKPASNNKTKDKDKEVKIIVAAHVSVPPSSENPFLQAIPNPQDISASNKPYTGRESEKNQLHSDRASECQKLLDRPLSTPALVSEARSNEFECPNSRSFILSQKKTSVLVTEDEISNNKSLETPFLNVSVNQEGSSLGLRSAKKSERGKSAQMRFENSLANRNGLISSLSTLAKNPAVKTHAVSDQALKDESDDEYVASIRTSKSGKSREIEIRPSLHWSRKLDGLMQDLSLNKSCSLEFAVSPTLEDKWHEDTDPPDLLSVLTVNHSSGYDVIPNKILECPSDLATPTESSAIQLPHRNLNKSKNSEVSFTEPIIANIPRETKPESKRDQYLSRTILSRDENVARVCSTERYVTAGPSGNIQAKIPVLSLRFLRRDETTVPIISKQVTVSNARIRKFDDPKASNEACTQTLASSAISPNELNTIGVGGSSIIDPSSKTLIASHKLISQ